MASEKFSYDPPPAATGHAVRELAVKSGFIEKRRSLREKVKSLNRVGLTNSEFARLCRMGLFCVQDELKTLGSSLHQAMKQGYRI